MRAVKLLSILGAMAAATPAMAVDFTYSGGVAVPAIPAITFGPASVFPITFNVSGLTSVNDINVTLTGLSHSFSDDIVMALVSPTNTAVLLLDNAGGSANWSNATLTIDQQAGGVLSNFAAPYGGNNGLIPGGSYRPSVYGLGTILSIALDGSNMDLFNGEDANGTWSLYIADNGLFNVGHIDSVTLSIDSDAAPTTAAVPEPASWAMMIGGFALAGAAIRRRKVGFAAA